MEVIAKTNEGFLIKATENEIKEIVNAVTGNKPKEIQIGQKIPAIDYASTITKIKSLKDDDYFKEILKYSKWFKETVDELELAVEKASEIE
jgi:hypothetical protein